MANAGTPGRRTLGRPGRSPGLRPAVPPTSRLNIRHSTAQCHRRVPSPALRAAVQRLTVEEDDEYGSVPHPDPWLAEQIEGLAAAL
ncbi:hypothetical protein OH809_35350 [Streptomyces sp. NBC_00873]|uniref:hypothetical protein n=1 Tax=unclassified Streptomyces TaxID=2593676 RepID=UPI003866A61E|nr:hypothetical protein OH809_35350 [Streptomyces sp. NBC_00873]WTA42618.1 hypothetical protein OH821_08360 [Streptomyces sp. NBC_00842]